MNDKLFSLIDTLAANRRLSLEEYRFLIDHRTPEAAAYLAELAVKARKAIYANTVYIRDRDQQHPQKRLPVLRHPAQQQELPALPPEPGGHSGLLPGRV